MQELDYRDIKKDYAQEIDQLRRDVPDLQAVKVRVFENFAQSAVNLRVGDTDLMMTVDQARNLAQALRQAAEAIERGVPSGSRKPHHRRKSRARPPASS